MSGVKCGPLQGGLVVLLVACVVGCSPEQVAAPDDGTPQAQLTVAVPTQPPDARTDDLAGDTRGRLAGDPEYDGGCLWIVSGDDVESMDEATAVRWPQGFGALFNPVRLVDPQGNVVASEGEIVVLGGGSMDPSIVLERCAVGDGPGWDASSVVRVDDWDSVPTPWRRTTGS